jgi:hypothetical protein
VPVRLPGAMARRFSALVVDNRDPEALAAFRAAVPDHRLPGRNEDGQVQIGSEAGSPGRPDAGGRSRRRPDAG